ncbi:MAG: DUF2240 family protein, partial [Candidatus Thermoplasmatota archaeon]|nr:DUF2240 family protein [Candidatus Thermoplasmatota archaeon]
DFVFALSLDFGWFNPKDAQKLLEKGLESELLVMDDNKVKPTFDYNDIEIPRGFKPSPEMLQKKSEPKGVFMKMIDEISIAISIPAKDVISQVNSVQDRMSVDIEVAALIVAKNNGVDLSDYFDTVEEEIGKRYRG